MENILFAFTAYFIEMSINKSGYIYNDAHATNLGYEKKYI